MRVQPGFSKVTPAAPVAAHITIHGGLLPAALTGPVRSGFTSPSPGRGSLGIEPSLSVVLGALRLRAGQADSLSAAASIAAVNGSRAVQPLAAASGNRRPPRRACWRRSGYKLAGADSAPPRLAMQDPTRGPLAQPGRRRGHRTGSGQRGGVGYGRRRQRLASFGRRLRSRGAHRAAGLAQTAALSRNEVAQNNSFYGLVGNISLCYFNNN